MEAQDSLPDEYRADIKNAVEILTEAGCTEVYLFGSLAKGDVKESSDIDLAVRGCPKGHFFSLYGRLMLELEHPVDLVNLHADEPFAKYLEEEGELIQIA
jgi:predicted nucleotidyltransferase